MLTVIIKDNGEPNVVKLTYENIWKEISPDSDWEFNFDGLITVCVYPSFIPIYDKAEADNSELPIEEVVKYESVKLGQE